MPFFLMASLFLVFATGFVLLVPWALAFRWAADSGAAVAAFVHIAAFLFFMGIALAFALGGRALDREG
ncbi:MAG: NADH-quinone oxidoreductase subunit A [Proteobacteria bacterium]|nr:NADH-quinone oxidoreductase subunit A [Pseudomonadota bacterium]